MGASLLLLPGASHFSLTFGQRKARGSECTPLACVRFLWHRDPAGLRGLIIRLALPWHCSSLWQGISPFHQRTMPYSGKKGGESQESLSWSDQQLTM